MSRTLSTAEVARIVGLKEGQIRSLVRSGLARPARRGRRYAFTFQDLVALRAAKDLIAHHVPAARVRRALAALAEEMGDRPVSALRMWAEGRRVAARDGGRSWDPETGQLLLDFDVGELAVEVEALRKRPPVAESEARDASELAQWHFARALDLEDTDPAAACDAYGQALEHDPDLVDAYVNLGRLAHESGHAREAVRLCELALERSPDDPVIHFNLALSLEDARGPEAALVHYRRAIDLDPEFADAHFNLGGLCERLGRPMDALRHLRAYRNLTRD